MMLLNIAGCLPVLVGLVILNHRTINSKQFPFTTGFAVLVL